MKYARSAHFTCPKGKHHAPQAHITCPKGKHHAPQAHITCPKGNRTGVSGTALNLRQEAFVDEYFKHGGNCLAAALAAGYTRKTAGDAWKWVNPEAAKTKDGKSKYRPELAAAIEARREQLKSERVADAQEIAEYLTSVLRGESRATVLAVEGCGDGCSEAKLVEKPPDEKERLKAAETLGKLFGLFTNRTVVDGAVPVVISGDADLTD